MASTRPFRPFVQVALVLAMALSDGEGNPGDHFRIVGGRKASALEFPYQVSLEQWTVHTCGGSIIDKNFVLTAAHCVKSLEYFKPIPSFVLRVRVGNDVARSGGTVYEVATIMAHEKYSATAKDDEHDIALLKTKTPFTFTDRVQPVPLVTGEPAEGEPAWITGFGQQAMQRSGLAQRHLMAVRLPIVALDSCRKALTGVADDMICAGRKTGHGDACTGDSGGPLVVKEGLAGIVAWGLGCGREGIPGVYTNVAFYREWIDDKLSSS